MVREYQLTRLYKAEEIALPYFEDTMEFDDVVRGCEIILDSKFVKQLIKEYCFITLPSKDFYVEEGASNCKYACATHEFARFPKGTKNCATICHELAHVLTINDTVCNTFTFHGREFAWVYLQLVQEFMGVDFYMELEEQFDIYNIDYDITGYL